MKEKIKNIIDNSYLASIATNTKDGIWVSDVIYVNDDSNFAIYWISDPEAKHSKAIDNNTSAEIALSITLSKESTDKKVGLQMQGFAHQVVGDTYDLTCKHWEKRRLSVPKKDEDALQGDVWYVFYPSVIEVFDEDQENKERILILSKEEIQKKRKQLTAYGLPYTYLWYDIPGYLYPAHRHTKPVSFYVLKGSVTFNFQDGTQTTLSVGDRWDEKIGSIHSAQAGDQGCLYLVGQLNDDDISVDI